MTILVIPYTKSESGPIPGNMPLIEGFLVYIIMNSVYLANVLEKRITFLKNDGGILTMFAMSLRPLWDRDMTCSIYVPFTPKMHHTKFEQNWLNCFRKKLKCLIGNTRGLSHDSRRRRTTTDENQFQ